MVLYFFGVRLSVIGQNADSACKQFQIGKFNYKEIAGGYSIRDTAQQISYYPDGFLNTFKVKWLSDCSFEMTFVKSTSSDQKTYSIGDVIGVNIDSTDGLCYTFPQHSKGRSFPYTYRLGSGCKIHLLQARPT